MYFLSHIINIDSKLSEKDFKHVYQSLYKVRTKWADIGLELGVNYRDIRAIEYDQRLDCDGGLRAMLYKRFDSGEPLSWRLICRALRQHTVGEACIAEEIESAWLSNAADHEEGMVIDDEREVDHRKRAQRRRKFITRRKREQRTALCIVAQLVHCIAILLHCACIITIILYSSYMPSILTI